MPQISWSDVSLHSRGFVGDKDGPGTGFVQSYSDVLGLFGFA